MTKPTTLKDWHRLEIEAALHLGRMSKHVIWYRWFRVPGAINTWVARKQWARFWRLYRIQKRIEAIEDPENARKRTLIGSIFGNAT